MTKFETIIKKARDNGLFMRKEYWAERSNGFVRLYKGNKQIRKVKI
jgi:hypothetical protein